MAIFDPLFRKVLLFEVTTIIKFQVTGSAATCSATGYVLPSAGRKRRSYESGALNTGLDSAAFKVGYVDKCPEDLPQEMCIKVRNENSLDHDHDEHDGHDHSNAVATTASLLSVLLAIWN